VTLQRPDIVIFDMDGTTVRHLNPRLLGLMEFLDDTSFKISRLWKWLFERKAKGPILLPCPDTPIKPPKSILVHKAIHKLRRKDVDLLVEPCPGIYSVIAMLKKENIPMAIVSNGLGKGYGEDIIEKFGLGDFFPITIFREDIKNSKPHPESLLLALSKLGINETSTQTIWYIGDRHKDVIAASRANDNIKADIIPIAYTMHAALAIIEKGYSPDQILLSYYDIYDALNALLSNERRIINA